MDEQNDERDQAEASEAGQGTWDRRSGNENVPVSEGVQPGEKGHGDGELEDRPDQLTGPSGVQREREDLAVYDPGRVGLGGDGDVDANPSDPASYPSPDEQRRGTSRDQPDL